VVGWAGTVYRKNGDRSIRRWKREQRVAGYGAIGGRGEARGWLRGSNQAAKCSEDVDRERVAGKSRWRDSGGSRRGPKTVGATYLGDKSTINA
jgi:hypothetical protein